MESDSPRSPSIGIPVAIVVGALVIAGALYFSKSAPDASQLAARASVPPQVAGQTDLPVTLVDVPIDEHNPTQGELNAPVTIIAFSDYECQYCKDDFENTFAEIKRAYIDTGKVRYVFKHFPLSQIHPLALSAAHAAACSAEQGKFWEYSATLFAKQPSFSPDDLKLYARSVGLDEKKFVTCLSEDAAEQVVMADIRAGLAAGIIGTPTYVIDGQLVDSEISFSQLRLLIEAALAKK